MKKQHLLVIVIGLVIASLVLSGCATAPAVSAPATTQPVSVTPTPTIAVTSEYQLEQSLADRVGTNPAYMAIAPLDASAIDSFFEVPSALSSLALGAPIIYIYSSVMIGILPVKPNDPVLLSTARVVGSWELVEAGNLASTIQNRITSLYAATLPVKGNETFWDGQTRYTFEWKCGPEGGEFFVYQGPTNLIFGTGGNPCDKKGLREFFDILKNQNPSTSLTEAIDRFINWMVTEYELK